MVYNHRVEVTKPDAPGSGLIHGLGRLGRFHSGPDGIAQGVNHEMPVCAPPALSPGMCDDALGIDPSTEKTFDSPGAGEGEAFAIYKGVTCLPGFMDYEAMARAALEAGASYAVETAVQTLLLDPASLAGSAMSVTDGLGYAHELLAANAGGSGFMLTGAHGAMHLAESRGVKSDGGMLYSIMGAGIIPGWGFGHGSTATGSQFYLWVTSGFDLWAGTPYANKGYDLKHNVEVDVVEQVYATSEPCFINAILIDPSL